MPFRRLLGLLLNNPQLIERLSETKAIRIAAQKAVGLYNNAVAKGLSATNKLEDNIKEKVEDFPKSKSSDESSFLSNFKQEMEEEYSRMKKDKKL
ncbi:protein NCBP2AS2-like [Ciona intestinalis]